MGEEDKNVPKFSLNFRQLIYAFIGFSIGFLGTGIINDVYKFFEYDDRGIYILFGVGVAFSIVAGILATWFNKKDVRAYHALPDEVKKEWKKGDNILKGVIAYFLISFLIYMTPHIYSFIKERKEWKVQHAISQLQYEKDLDYFNLLTAGEIIQNRSYVLGEVYDDESTGHLCPKDLKELDTRVRQNRYLMPENVLYATKEDGTACHVGIKVKFQESIDQTKDLYPKESDFNSTGIYTNGFDGSAPLIYDVTYPIHLER